MATETRAVPPMTIPAGSTGLVARRFVTVNTSGKAAYPAAGAPIEGVTITSSTGSTEDNQALAVLTSPNVARVDSTASTVSVGDLVAASSVGKIRALQAGDYCVGRVVGGSSGGARTLSVRLQPIGTT